MARGSPNLFRQILVRVGIIVIVVVPISFLYDMALSHLNARQLAVQTQTIIITLPFILAAVILMIRWNLAPLTRAMKKLGDGDTVPDNELTAVERRALIMPYLAGLYSIMVFFGTSLIVNLSIYFRAGLSHEMFLYLVASSATTSVMLGLGALYFSRPPLRDALRFVMERHPDATIKPPFFVPISIKVTGAFVIMAALVLVFSGLLSSTIIKRTANRERQAQQKSALQTIVDLAAQSVDTGALHGTLSRLGAAGKFYALMDKDFSLIGHREGSPPQETISALSKKASGEMVVDEKTGWSWTWAEAPSGHDKVLSGWAPVSAEMAAEELKKYYLAAALIALLVSAAVGYLIARDISGTLKQLSESAARISQGASSEAMVPGNEDETGILARAFNRMGAVLLSQLRDELSHSRAMIEAINAALKTLSPMSQELLAFTSQQASASSRQSTATEHTAEFCEQVNAVSEQISRTSAKVVEAAEGTLEITRQGRERIALTESSFNEIMGRVQKISEAVRKLSEHSKTIDDVIAIVEEISDQINLLSLNAALEAAGAKEYGTRFGVIAKEVQRLANIAGDSTDRIKGIVAQMQKLAKESLAITEQGVEAVGVGKVAIEEMSVNFDDIFQASSQVAELVKNIDAITHQQANSSSRMSHSIIEVRDTARASRDAVKSLQDSVKSINDIINQLKRHAGEGEGGK